MPQPTSADLLKFFGIDGWIEAKKARGGSRRDRVFTKVAPDGRALWAKVSHGRKEIGDPRLWHRIWTEQLALQSEDEFWNALQTSVPVTRPGPEAPPTPPEWLIDRLVHQLGMTPGEAQSLSPAEAMRRWNEHIAQPRE